MTKSRQMLARIARYCLAGTAAVLAASAPAWTQSAEHPWTTVGSTCVVDEASRDLVEFDKDRIMIKAGVVKGTVIARCNVVETQGLLVDGPGVFMRVRYGAGMSARVVVRLMEYRPATGATNERMKFDSNLFPGSFDKTIKNCTSGNFFDFTQRVYYAQIQLEKLASGGNPSLSAIQIGVATTCP
jgi:hypothetical protein